MGFLPVVEVGDTPINEGSKLQARLHISNKVASTTDRQI